MSVSYSLGDISTVIDGQLRGDPEQQISTLLIDSRKVVSPEGTLFFAIEGDQHDGHNYIDHLVDKGFNNFVVTKKQDRLNDRNQIVVTDSIEALHKLAQYHRERFSYPVLAITGSNGKTVVKEWLFQLMQDRSSIVRSPKSYNSQVGVPLSLWKMQETNELAIIEAGISKPGEMEMLRQMIQPTDVLITNIHEAHDENFVSRVEKAAEKTKLVNQAQRVFYCSDYPEIVECISQKDLGQVSWSKVKKEDRLFVKKIEKRTIITDVSGVYKGEELLLSIPFNDDASIENVIHCWLFLLENGFNNDDIQERINMLSSVSMRLELKAGTGNNTLINDSYNSDVASLGIALDLLNQQHQHPKKILVLSDILESGRSSELLYKEVAGLIATKGVDELLAVGSELTAHRSTFKNTPSKFFDDTEELLAELMATGYKNSAILIKGARKFKFEKISHALEQKSHETVLEINLSAIQSNLNYYRSKLKKSTKLMVMVKAFSYGSGSYEIANLLQFNNVDYLGVAYTDEGVELRKAGITVPIMVMNPEKGSFATMIKHRLEPEIYSLDLLTSFIDALQSNLMYDGEAYPVHLKIDTGMHRLGFEKDDLDELIEVVKGEKCISIRSVFSHLVGSGDADLDDFTQHQIDVFNSVSKQIEDSIAYGFDKHILNSGGIERFPDRQYNMVRLGIGLHGIGVTNQAQKRLTTAATLKTSISQVRKVKKGETIGYNRSGVAEDDITIATVSIGYADGYSRRLGNGIGKMELNGKLVSVIGDVCMDMCMLDVTDVACKVGDSVIVFGSEKVPLTQVAKEMGTIPYEVLTGISQRVKRVYFQE